MAVELKDLGEYLGFTEDKLKEFETPEALKAEVDKQFIRRDNALKDKDFKKAVTGELLGSIATKTKSIAKTYGIEFQPEEIKDQPVEKIIELGFSKQATASTNAIEEAKKLAGKPEEAFKELQEKYNKQTTTLNDKIKLLDETNQAFTAHKEQTAQKIKNAEITFKNDQLLSGITPRPDVTELDKIGFNAAVNQRLKFDYDENSKFIVTDLEGHLIPNKNKHGEHLSPEEAVKNLAAELKYTAVNPHSKPTPKSTTPAPAVNNTPVPVDKTKNKINTFTPIFSTR